MGRKSIDDILALFASLSPAKSRKRLEMERASFDGKL